MKGVPLFTVVCWVAAFFGASGGGFRLGRDYEHRKLEDYVNTGQVAGEVNPGTQLCWFLREVPEGQCKRAGEINE